MYYSGRGVPQSFAEAFSWTHKAAQQGEAEAQRDLGFMYSAGQGAVQDYTEAAKWFRKAANQDDAKAQYMLGNMHAIGRGVPLDNLRAHMWLNLSAAKGEKKAAEQRDVLARRMTEAQIAEAQKLAREWNPTSQP
jgi:uncharacterized protein